MFRVNILKGFISRVVEINNRMAKDAFKLKKKLKDVRQTAGQAEELQKYVKSKSKQQIAGKIDQMSRNESQLRDYINKFNNDHQNRINILDLSEYVREYKDLNQPGLKKHELEMLDQFRKRRADIKAQQYTAKILEEENQQDDFGEELLNKAKRRSNLTDFPITQFQKFQGEQKNQQELDEFIELDRQFSKDQAQNVDFYENFDFSPQKKKVPGQQNGSEYKQGIFDIHDSFICCILHRDSTTKVTTLNRVNTCRTIVFMGNGTGLMSYGRGRGTSHKLALQRAIYNCKRNIIAIPIDPTLCVPQPLYAHFQDYKLSIRPSRQHNPWGHPVMATMMSVAGIFDCGFKTVKTDTNKYNIVNSLFKAVTQNRTPQQISQRDGRKIYRKQWIKPIPFNAANLNKIILN